MKTRGVYDSPIFINPTFCSGSQDGRVHVWSADTGEEVTVLDGGHPSPSHCVQFNPKYMMMASSCRSLVSVGWIDKEENEKKTKGIKKYVC